MHILKVDQRSVAAPPSLNKNTPKRPIQNGGPGRSLGWCIGISMWEAYSHYSRVHASAIVSSWLMSLRM
jgi:hypothetical protein